MKSGVIKYVKFDTFANSNFQGPMKKTEVKNVALFARPGTFDLGNFDLSIGDLKVKPRTHIIVITDS